MAKPCTLSRTERIALETLINAYDTARAELLDRATEIVDKWETELDEKSEKWKDSDAGAESQERLDTLQAWIEESIPEDSPTIPEDI